VSRTTKNKPYTGEVLQDNTGLDKSSTPTTTRSSTSINIYSQPYRSYHKSTVPYFLNTNNNRTKVFNYSKTVLPQSSGNKFLCTNKLLLHKNLEILPVHTSKPTLQRFHTYTIPTNSVRSTPIRHHRQFTHNSGSNQDSNSKSLKKSRINRTRTLAKLIKSRKIPINMSSHLTTLVNPYLRKPKPCSSTQGSTDDTKSLQNTNSINSKTIKSISSNISQQTDNMSDTNDGQWQINTKTLSNPKTHTSDTSPKLSDPFSNNMFNSLMESNKYNEKPLVQNAEENNTQTTRKERENKLLRFNRQVATTQKHIKEEGSQEVLTRNNLASNQHKSTH
jgi:hypothetical protein